MKLILRQNGKSIAECDPDLLDADIRIGRGVECEWRVEEPADSVGRLHGRVCRRGRSLWFEDAGSRNGSFCRGKRVSRVRLRPGTRVSLGECLLEVESADGETHIHLDASLVVLSGRSRGARMPLQVGEHAIGSGADAALVLTDDALISRRHAAVTGKEDGSFWVRDLGSANGTRVNGEPLRSGQERLLQNGDTLQLAHVDVRFDERPVRSDEVLAWRRLFVLMASLAAVTGLFGLYLLIRPPAEHYIRGACSLAAACRFADSREALRQAERSRRIRRNHRYVGELFRSVAQWERTWALWSVAQESLQARDWTRAMRALGALACRRKDAWMWDAAGSGLATRQMADDARLALTAFLDAGVTLQAEQGDAPTTAAALARLDAALGRLPSPLPACFVPLADAMRKRRCRLEDLHAAWTALDDAVASLSCAPWPPPVALVRIVVRETAAVSNAAAALRAFDVRWTPLLDSLDAAVAAVERMSILAREGAMAAARCVDLVMPPAEVCSAMPPVRDARGSILDRWESRRACLATAQRLYAEATNAAADAEALLHSERDWSDANLKQALACDCLELPLPRRNRTEPAGAYDGLVGIEAFYRFLRDPGQHDAGIDDRGRFPTVLGRTAAACRAMGAFTRFIDLPANAWLCEGEVARQVMVMQQRLDDVRDLAGRLAAYDDGADPRRALIARGVSVCLLRAVGDVADAETLAADVESRMQSARDAIAAMNASFDAAGREEKKRLREAILAAGIPGDAVVKRMWIRDAGAREDAAANAAAPDLPRG